ncbi:MAG: hypothetical protein AAFV62_03030 [Pseudomonadota bacterium]
MPPKIPAVLVFVAIYLAIMVGGGPVTLARDSQLTAFLFPELGRFTIAEALACATVFFAVLDASLRPADTVFETLLSFAVVALVAAVAVLWPEAVTPSFLVIALATIADAVGTLSRCGARHVFAPRYGVANADK